MASNNIGTTRLLKRNVGEKENIRLHAEFFLYQQIQVRAPEEFQTEVKQLVWISKTAQSHVRFAGRPSEGSGALLVENRQHVGDIFGGIIKKQILIVFVMCKNGAQQV